MKTHEYALAMGFPATGKFHVLRHSCTSHMLELGAPVKVVRDILGRAELATTNLYAHSVSDAREIVGKLDYIGKSANPANRKRG